MSVEKLSDLSRSEIESCPFSQIPNSVIESIKDNDAFRLYTYLVAKSRDWKVIKEWTAKQCGVGERKAKQCWSYLERCGLIRYKTIRGATGKIERHDVVVLRGTIFNPEEPFLKASGAESAPVESYPQKTSKLSKNGASHRCNYPPSGETTRVDIARLLNKDITNKEKAYEKKKSFCDDKKINRIVDNSISPVSHSGHTVKTVQPFVELNNSKRHKFAESMNQMANEGRHIAESEAFKRAGMPDSIKTALGIGVKTWR